jgi:hypothetical protein
MRARKRRWWMRRRRGRGMWLAMGREASEYERRGFLIGGEGGVGVEGSAAAAIAGDGEVGRRGWGLV